MKRLLFLLAAASLALPIFFANAASANVDRGIAFIRTTQQADGGFGGFGDGQTMDAIFAIRSAGIDPTTVKTGGKSPADFLVAKAAAQTSPGAAAKGAMAAVAMNLDPRSVGGVNLVARVIAANVGGHFGSDDFTQSLAMLALSTVGEPVPASAAAVLRANQLADGGWGFGGFSDPDTTALAIQALIAAAGTVPPNALAYLRAQQLGDGGWGFGDSNANSTAFVVQALLALNLNPDSADFTKNGKTPTSFLLSQQLPNGSFAGFDPAFATNQVVPALAGRTFANAPLTALPQVNPPVSTVTPGSTAVPPPVPPSTGPRPIPAYETPTPTATAVPSATATRPAPTSTATGVATAIVPGTAVVTPSVVPAPPATGSGSASEGGAVPEIVLAGLVLVAVAGALFAVRSRSR